MKRFVEDIGNLFFEVYTIGYADKGESQVIFLKDTGTDNILFSCVIDCFADNSINISRNILKENGVILLDCFIWTHTDEDHSIGIEELIDSFCSKETNFIIPEGLYGNESDFVNYNEVVKSTFEKINNFNKNSNYNVHTASVNVNYEQQLFKRLYSDTRNLELKLEIVAIAPISAIVRRRWEFGFVKKKNDLSIATIFKIGELSLLFGGDIENQTINLIPEYFFKDLSYIKIPHHTSTSANKLIDKIDKHFECEKIPSVATTTFKDHNLPNEGLIAEYLKYVRVFNSTGIGQTGYGYVKTVFNIARNELVEEALYGDAHVCILN